MVNGIFCLMDVQKTRKPYTSGKLLATKKLGGGFKYCLCSPLWEDSQFDDQFFQMGWNHQLDIYWGFGLKF